MESGDCPRPLTREGCDHRSVHWQSSRCITWGHLQAEPGSPWVCLGPSVALILVDDTVAGIQLFFWVLTTSKTLNLREFKFTGGPVVKTASFHRQGPAFDPWSGN